MTDGASAAAQTNTEAAATSTQATTTPPPAQNSTPATADPAAQAQGSQPSTTTPETPAKPVVPEKYELKLADGAYLDPARIESISAYAKASGLSNEQAQAILDRENDAVKSHVEGERAALETRKAGWMNEVKSDKEFGGEQFNKNMEISKRFVDRFADEHLKKELIETGMGNYPGLVKLFVRASKSMAEDQLVLPNSGSSSPQKSIEEIFYPNMSKG